MERVERKEPIKHIQAPGYVAAVATGITLNGPTPDNMMHVTFFRDVAIPTEDSSAIVKTQPGDAPGSHLAEGAEAKMTFKVERHNLATISMQRSQLEGFGEALVRMKAFFDEKNAEKAAKA